MNRKVPVNGAILVNGIKDRRIDAQDRGLQYGDGLFETLALIDGRVRRLERHLSRLQEGCTRLGIAFPGSDAISSDLARIRSNGRSSRGQSVLKLVVTRGFGTGRGYGAAPGQPTRILAQYAWPEYPAAWSEEGVAVRLCDLRLAAQPALAGLKHLNRLEQVLARQEWEDPAIAEGLLCDARDSLVCGTMSNVFIVRDGRILTPSLDRSGVAGTVRAAILAWSRRNSQACDVAKLTLEDLERADEVFLTNAIVGIWPVKQFGHRRWVPGPVTRRLADSVLE